MKLLKQSLLFVIAITIITTSPVCAMSPGEDDNDNSCASIPLDQWEIAFQIHNILSEKTYQNPLLTAGAGGVVYKGLGYVSPRNPMIRHLKNAVAFATVAKTGIEIGTMLANQGENYKKSELHQSYVIAKQRNGQKAALQLLQPSRQNQAR
ncbi:MAG TPA: hypothetical protein VGT41_01280 [Candidatus Babeliales bacterium]|nr:hypothetical protein [Candidatus Babeliales bacterium]